MGSGSFFNHWDMTFLEVCKHLSGSIFEAFAITRVGTRRVFLVDRGCKPKDNVSVRVQLPVIQEVLGAGIVPWTVSK